MATKMMTPIERADAHNALLRYGMRTYGEVSDISDAAAWPRDFAALIVALWAEPTESREEEIAARKLLATL